MKHLLLLPAMLFVSAMSIAQLYVSPNDNGTGTPADDTDSYVFVNDQVLFVEQDVNLTENTVDPETTASIYLRNGSQLIQGSTNSLNAGSGYISVYRETPESDAWDYTFYGSPVGNNVSLASTPIAGNINFGVLSFHTPEYDPMATDYTAPLSLTNGIQTVPTTDREGDFVPSTNELNISTRWMYTRASGTASPWIRMHSRNNVPAGQGFIMKGVNRDGSPSTHSFVYDFRGRPNNGTFNFTTIPVTGSDMEEVLTGNPYPSALDLNRVFYDTGTGDANATDNLSNSEIDSILFWDEDRTINSHFYIDNKGGFGVWIPLDSEPDGTGVGDPSRGDYTVATFYNYDGSGNQGGSTGDMGLYYHRRFAPVGQGFYFQTVNTGTGDLTTNQVSIKNKHRRFQKETPTTSEFRNTDPSTSMIDPGTGVNTNPEWSKLRIYTFFDESHFRDMVLNFNDNSTDFYDRGLDARHPMDAVFAEAYFPVYVNEGDDMIDQFVIQTLPFKIDKMVPYALTLDQQTNVIVQVVQEENFTPEAFLYDSQENTYQQITGDSTASILLNAGVYEDRFFIVFKGGDYRVEPPLDDEYPNRNNHLSIVEEVKQNVTFFQNNTLGQLEVSNPEAYNIKYAHMFDMTGKLVQTKAGIGEVTNFTMNTAMLSDGLYLMKLVTADNVSVDYKALVHNKR